jgi:hypothetical protein
MERGERKVFVRGIGVGISLRFRSADWPRREPVSETAGVDIRRNGSSVEVDLNLTVRVNNGNTDTQAVAAVAGAAARNEEANVHPMRKWRGFGQRMGMGFRISEQMHRRMGTRTRLRRWKPHTSADSWEATF